VAKGPEAYSERTLGGTSQTKTAGIEWEGHVPQRALTVRSVRTDNEEEVLEKEVKKGTHRRARLRAGFAEAGVRSLRGRQGRRAWKTSSEEGGRNGGCERQKESGWGSSSLKSSKG
jgi:hypothetical protein